MKISIVVAASLNNCIGVNNTLPWRQSDDLKRFKAITLGHPMIMGRKTYDSIGKPLPGRTTIVVTRQKDWECAHSDVLIAHSLYEAIDEAKAVCERLKKNEVMLVGGAELYRQALPIVDKIYLTRIDTHIDGDAYFEQLDAKQWQKISHAEYEANEKNQYPYIFIDLERTDTARIE